MKLNLQSSGHDTQNNEIDPGDMTELVDVQTYFLFGS